MLGGEVGRTGFPCWAACYPGYGTRQTTGGQVLAGHRYLLCGPGQPPPAAMVSESSPAQCSGQTTGGTPANTTLVAAPVVDPCPVQI